MSPLLLLSFVFAPAWATHADPSETIRVNNPAKAPRTEVVRLEELWRVGEDDEVVFGAIGSVVLDGDGQVYVADMQAKAISVFSPDGEFLRNLGREGEGPGEFQEPRSLVLMPNGNVGVIYEQPPRVICFRPSDGEFVEDFHLTEDPDHSLQRLSRVAYRGGVLVAYGSDISEGSQGMTVVGRLMRFDATGRFLGQCDSLEAQFSFVKPVVRERVDLMWTVGPDGRVYVNRDLAYDFTVHGKDCAIERSFTREFEPLKRTTAELDSVRAYYRRVGGIGDMKLELLDRARDVSWLSVDDGGRLWVLSSRGRLDLPADSLGFFDIFDARGKLERTVDLKGESGKNDLYFMDRDRFFVAHRDTMELIAYRMPGLRR